MAFDSARQRIVLFGESIASAAEGPLSGTTWERPLDPLLAGVSSIMVPNSATGVAPETAINIRIALTTAALRGGAVVTFGGPIYEVNGATKAPVTVPAGARSIAGIPVAFPALAACQNPTVTITAQVSGTPEVSLNVTILSNA
jgi:hypothetical protein